MRSLVIAIAASVALHLVLLFLAHRAADPVRQERRKRLVAVVVQKPPTPKPSTPPPPPLPPRVARTMPKRVAKPLPVEPPRPATPPPPPQGFSVDTKATSAQSSVSVAAKEGGGNAFADPAAGLPAGDKVAVRPPPPPPPLEPAQWLTDAVDRSPPYPPAALRSGVEGQVLLRVCVATSGSVDTVTVLKGLGFGCDEAAVEWAKRRWRFKPAHRGGQAVSTCMLQPMRFELQR